MHIHRYERAWLYFSIGLISVFFLAVFTAAFAGGITLPSPAGQVNPADLTNTDFSTPGVREIAPGHYEAYMVGQIWQWQPNEIRIPAGSELSFYLTSRDVQHGFKVVDTDINMMVIPGQISHTSRVFDKPGEYLIVCHEFCGAQHQTMAGKIIVEPAAQ